MSITVYTIIIIIIILLFSIKNYVVFEYPKRNTRLSAGPSHFPRRVTIPFGFWFNRILDPFDNTEISRALRVYFEYLIVRDYLTFEQWRNRGFRGFCTERTREFRHRNELDSDGFREHRFSLRVSHCRLRRCISCNRTINVYFIRTRVA